LKDYTEISSSFRGTKKAPQNKGLIFYLFSRILRPLRPRIVAQMMTTRA
jgi:uncharacterized protein YggT (Ycf19 family)